MKVYKNCQPFATSFLRGLVASALLLVSPALVTATDTRLTYDGNGNQSVGQTATAAAPVILGPTSRLQLVAAGTMAGFSVNLSSPLAVTYQWYFNGNAIAGATGDTLLLSNVSLANDGNYTVTVTNNSGSATSTAHTLLVDNNSNGLPDGWELTWFGNLNQPAHADYDDDGIYDLDEFLNSTNPVVKDAFVWIAASGDFNTPANWGRYRAPKAGDTAFVNTGTFTLPSNTLVEASQVTINVPYTTPPGDNYILKISGQWTFGGSFTPATERYFQVAGGGSITVTGTTNLNGAHLFVEGPSKLTFSNLASHTLPAGLTQSWQAYGTGSEIIFSNLAAITGSVTPYSYLDMFAYNGGKVSLPALTTITNPDDSDAYINSGVRLYARDLNSLLSAPVLASFQDNDSHPASLLSACRMAFCPRRS